MQAFIICLFAFFSFGLPQWAIAQQPDRSEAVFMDGIKAYITDKPAQAEQYLKQYLQVHPNSAVANYYLSGLFAENKDLSQAKLCIQKSINQDPENKWYRERLAVILSMNREYEKAADEYAALGRKEKLGEEYLLKAALLYANIDQHNKALQALEEIEQKRGYDEDIALRKIQIYRKAKNYIKVEELARQMIQTNPKDAGNYSQLVDFLLEQGEFTKAKQLIDEGIRLLPNDIIMQISLAQYYQKIGDNDKYEQILKQTITNKNLDAGTQVSLLIPYLQQLGADSSKRSEGLALAAQLAEQHTNNADIQALYGDLLMYENRNDSAAAMYKRALALDATRFPVWQQLLFAYSEKKNADSLIKYSEEALLYFPNQAMAHYLNGIGYYHKSDYTPAIRAINRALDLQPEDNKDLRSDMFSMLGDIHQSAKNYSLSDSNYRKALQLNPDNATVLNNFAYYLSLRKTQLNEAEKMSKRSLELRPGEASFLDTYGWILYQQGKYAEAKKYIEQAIGANPQFDGTLFEHLGDIFFKMGQTPEALKQWQVALEKGVDDQDLLEKKLRDKKLYED